MYKFDDYDNRVIRTTRDLVRKITNSNVAGPQYMLDLLDIHNRLGGLPKCIFQNRNFSIELIIPNGRPVKKFRTRTWQIGCLEGVLNIRVSEETRRWLKTESTTLFEWTAKPEHATSHGQKHEYLPLIDASCFYLEETPLVDLSQKAIKFTLEQSASAVFLKKTSREQHKKEEPQEIRELENPQVNTQGIVKLFESGLENRTKCEPLTYETWIKALKGDAKKHDMNWDTKVYHWLWKSLEDFPLAKIKTSTTKHLLIEQAHAVFIIELDHSKLQERQESISAFEVNQTHRVWVTTSGCVEMIIGRGGRLQLCDIDCSLSLFPGPQDEPTGSQETEAKTMGIAKEDVKIIGKMISVSARSLNHAYTIASRRFEAGRRSYGGSVYKNAFYVTPKTNKLDQLERLRSALEKKTLE